MWIFNFWKNLFFLKFLTVFGPLGKNEKCKNRFNFKGSPVAANRLSEKSGFVQIWPFSDIDIGAQKNVKYYTFGPFHTGCNTSKSNIFSKILPFLESARQELSNGMWKFNFWKKIFLKFLTVFGPLGKNEKWTNRFNFSFGHCICKQAFRKIWVCPNLTISWYRIGRKKNVKNYHFWTLS